MLKLKRVEIQGFKSFFDRTEMRFNGTGIAAVVGPNGCGKSNLSDAISWVLGEQSAKSLRGARMEDVIFAGTREKKPLGMASVTMTLVEPAAHAGPMEIVQVDHPGENGNGAPNGNGTAKTGARPGLSSATGEITVTRRLYRSGESEYLINGRPARLRDIQEIFMGTGLGPESYAIIEQGRIGQILSNKPADRRAVIEEAAGITRFKTKKRLAEAKLEGAKQNLNRVFDILEEVGRQCNSLKRQASKARRYEELRGEMVGHLKVALTGRFRLLEREAAKLALDLAAATNDYQRLSAEVEQKDAAQTKLLEQNYQTEAELTGNRKHLAELRVDAERTRGRLESQARQIGVIEQRLGQGETEAQDLERRLTQATSELEIHTRNLVEVDQHANTARAALSAQDQARNRLGNAVRDQERTMEQSRQQVLRLLSEASSLRNQLGKVEEYLASLQRDRDRSDREVQGAGAEIARLDAVRTETTEKLQKRQAELELVAANRKSVEQELATERNRLVEMRRKLENLKGQASHHRARRDSLAEVIQHRSYTTESVKRLFKAIERGQASDFKPAGVLADFVEVLDGRFEKATEEFLHDELEYVVVKDWAEAERGIGLMQANVDGRATFLVEPEGEQEGGACADPEPAGEGLIGPLRNVLRLTNGLTHAPAALIPRLARCYLAEDRASAQKLASQHLDCYFLSPDGVSYHGHAVSGGRKSGAGPLALKRELREIAAQVAKAEREVQQTQSELEAIETGIARMGEELERLRSAQQAQEKDALALDHELRKIKDETGRANQRLNVAKAELERLRKEGERSIEQKQRNAALVEEKDALRATQEQALEAARAQLQQLQQELQAASEQHATVRADLASLEERRRAEQSSKARLENQIRDLTRRRDDLGREMERLGVDRTRLLQDNIELDARAAELAGQIEKLDAVVASLAEREAALRAELTASDETLKAMRAETQAAQERRSHLEVELVKRQAELKFLDETSRKELATPVSELAESVETVPDEGALTDAEAAYQQVKSRIDALGPVNPSALEEFEQAQQRYDFLNAQRQDLLDSIRDTERAIQEIDNESRKRFGEAFEEINKHFKEMFTTLFGGGAAEMRLTDEENLAESGIDIVASPPGKKLQSVLLLSGGEKSLTAMALLMAIFRYQPSPFCILDEVDAPLDEPNIMRLTRLIQEMSLQTQFIVITHAKRTMEAAQALYGVTMQEPGVSKLVSVRFEPAMAN